MGITRNAGYWIDRLGLASHVEGGWYREIWRAGLEIPRLALPADYAGCRSSCSLIYYLLQGNEVSQCALPHEKYYRKERIASPRKSIFEYFLPRRRSRGFLFL
jgi:predicted cupin superfamily sugar epimerase